jgi:hypothetical protein
MLDVSDFAVRGSAAAAAAETAMADVEPSKRRRLMPALCAEEGTLDLSE